MSAPEMAAFIAGWSAARYGSPTRTFATVEEAWTYYLQIKGEAAGAPVETPEGETP